MTAFRNFAGFPFRNGPEAKRQPFEKVARVTGLEPATSGVTGRTLSERKQRPFRKRLARNDARAVREPQLAFGTRLTPLPGRSLIMRNNWSSAANEHGVWCMACGELLSRDPEYDPEDSCPTCGAPDDIEMMAHYFAGDDEGEPDHDE